MNFIKEKILKFIGKNKIIIKIFIFVSVLVFLYVFVINRSEKENFYSSNISEIRFEKYNNNENIDNNIDTDADGLYDWEEKIYKTNPLKKDTDNDGLSDYDEINNDTNPLVHGDKKKEKIDDIVQADGIIQEIKWIKNDTKIKKSLIKKVKKEENNTVNFTKEYLIYKRDINKIGDENIAMKIIGGKKEYSMAISSAIKLKVNDNEKKKILYISEIFKKQSDNYDKIIPYIETEILKEKVINLKKIYSVSSYNLKKISEYDYDNDLSKDNVFAKYIDGYSQTISEINKNFKDIHNFVIKNKIKFEHNEPGWFFMYSL